MKWQFSGVAQTGLMVPRNVPGEGHKLRQIRWSADILFKVLNPSTSRTTPSSNRLIAKPPIPFLDLDRACAIFSTPPPKSGMETLIEVPAVSPRFHSASTPARSRKA